MAVARENKFDMISRLRVADYLTLSNALSMFCSIHQRFVAAYVFIFLGYEFDRFDGMVARWRNECSEWGKELDSLSDLVTFVVAPAIMLFSLGFHTLVDQGVLAFYVVCGVARLARFNVAADLVPKDGRGKPLYQEGFATAYAALVISTVVAVFAYMDWSFGIVSSQLFLGTWLEFHPAMVVVGLLSTMMISKRLRFTVDLGLAIPVLTTVVFVACWIKLPA
ncbi:phosphatidylserine synthase [Colletotrichum tofieldiae]|nr:phosphatidylserine synthase [Colletotrichum tofieldiae]